MYIVDIVANYAYNPRMIEKANQIKDTQLAERMAYKEKPYRDLAINLKDRIKEPGMANAYSTVISLADNAGAELTQGERWEKIPDSVAPSQVHVAEAAHEYVAIITEEDPFRDTPGRTIFDSSKFAISSPTEANWAKEVVDVFGVTAHFGAKRKYTSGIPGVILRVLKNTKGVTIVAEPTPRKKALANS